ncbi:MAG: OmpH family outer membrane protein [Planctomycetota bacterium]|nr:MAG: OmpH family outer membrane protein [Planctomycetota bacterium]
MRRYWIWLVFFLFVFLYFFFVSAGFSLPSNSRKRIVLFHFQKILEQSSEVKENRLWLKKQTRFLEKKVQEYKLEIKKLYTKLKALSPKSRYYEKTKQLLQLKVAEMQIFVQNTKARIQKLYRERMERAVASLEGKIRAFLARRNYSLVWKIEEKGLFYYDPALDITPEILRHLRSLERR